jgi:multiple sugar transport system permease protein
MNNLKTDRVTKKKMFILIVNVFISIGFLFPLYWTLISSLKNKGEIYLFPPSLIPIELDLTNYVNLFIRDKGAYLKFLQNSIIIDITTIAVVTTISVLAGFAFSKLELIGKKVWMTLILFTTMVPFQALMVPLYNVMSQFKLLNSLVCMVIIYATYQTPFCIFLMKNSFDMIPNTLREAAHIDGASNFEVFKKVYIPLTLPGIVTTIVYSAYTTWNDYLIALTFGGISWKTFNVGIADLATGDHLLDWGAMTAGSIVSLIPIIILFLCLQKYFVKGIMSGAIK